MLKLNVYFNVIILWKVLEPGSQTGGPGSISGGFDPDRKTFV